MEQEVLRLLEETQNATNVQNATAQIKTLYTNDAFPIALVHIAIAQQVDNGLRQTALLTLKNFIVECWGEEFHGHVLSNELKAQLRASIMPLLAEPDRRLRVASAYAVSKIASFDFPEDWPGLVEDLLGMTGGDDNHVHGALRVLVEVVEDFTDEQFFSMAHKLVQMLSEIAVNEQRNFTVRSLAISVFRASMDLLEMVKAKYPEDVKDFLTESLNTWVPFFTHILDLPLPENKEDPALRGLITIKTQVLRTVVKVRGLFGNIFSPYAPGLFGSTWNSLNTLKERYVREFVEDVEDGRLIDSDELPYSFDLLILEALDFVKACVKTKNIKDEVERGEGGSSPLDQLVYASILLSQITAEDAELWEIDLNVFLCEETAVTADYSPRNAAGDLMLELCQWRWLGPRTSRTLWNLTQHIFQSDNAVLQEAALYIWGTVLGEYCEEHNMIDTDITDSLYQCLVSAMQNQDNTFTRARAYLTAGALVELMGAHLGDRFISLLEQTIHAATHDSSALIKMSCIKVLQRYLSSLPHEYTLKYQAQIINSISAFLPEALENGPDDAIESLVVMCETLHAILGKNYSIALDPSLNVIDLLFSLVSNCLGNLQLTGLVQDTLQGIAEDLYGSFMPLCTKIMPILNGVIDQDTLDKPNLLTQFALETFTLLSQSAPSPLPDGYIAMVVPRLARILIVSTDKDLLQKGCECLKEIVSHDPKQLLEWHDESQKSGLEVALVIIDRLLRPDVDDYAAKEVGGLAAEIVERLSDHLGPFLSELLRAVAERLATAQEPQFILSLILVFARLAIKRTKDVVDFLANISIGPTNGLQVVLTKWLDNSSYFNGYTEIRQNVMALGQLYLLDDARIKSIIVKGDLIITNSTRIITRSQARNSKSLVTNTRLNPALINSVLYHSDPDQYTQIPVPLKIIKIFVQELGPGLEQKSLDSASRAAGGRSQTPESDDEWEDAEDFGFPGTKEELLALGGEGGSRNSRRQDDATHTYLVEFFRNVAATNAANFNELYTGLSGEEKYQLSLLNQTRF